MLKPVSLYVLKINSPVLLNVRRLTCLKCHQRPKCLKILAPPACVKSKVLVSEVWQGKNLAATFALLKVQTVRGGQPRCPVVEPDNLEMLFSSFHQMPVSS